jgi:hypothetical protein
MNVPNDRRPREAIVFARGTLADGADNVVALFGVVRFPIVFVTIDYRIFIASRANVE